MQGILLLGLLAGAPARSAAQKPELKRPGETPTERPPEPKKKKVKGPRALALVQFDAKGRAALIPIAILVDGKFYDAGAYKADPVPMALEAGVVYEAEQTGDSQGLFTVAGALHSKTPGNAHPWYGAGTFLPQGEVAKKTSHKAEDTPVGIDSSGDAPPRLTRKDSSKAASDSNSSSSAPASGTADKPADPSAKPAPNQVPSGDKSAGNKTSNAPSAAAPPNADTGAKPDGDKSSSSAGSSQAPAEQAPAARSQASSPSKEKADDSYYRPTLRRGKPTTAAPEEEDPTGPQPVSSTSSGAASSASPNAAPIRVVPAISDDGGPDPRSYKYFWKTGEEDEKRNQMLALAANEVRLYALQLAKNHISETPVTPKAAANRRTAAKESKPVFDNVQFRGYDIWLNNQLVMVLTADASIPGWSQPGANAQPYHVTLVARTDIYGDLKKIHSGITDRFHLDVTPQLEFIDVVDADGDGRGEMLFRETSDAGSGYIIYRATPDKLWKLFDSLSAE